MILFGFILLSYMVRWTASASCETAEVFHGKRLEVEPYVEENLTDLIQCYLNCHDDNKCNSLNYSIKKSICQLLRESHKTLTNDALKDAYGWSYLVNSLNGCNQEPYPCAQTELCERRTMPRGEYFLCIHKVFGVPIRSLGCFQDTWLSRAIPSLEGEDPILDGDYQTRKNPVQKCYHVARSRGFPGFAVQHGGDCRSSPDILATYNKHGPSSNCGAGGEGGNWANDVYLILGKE